MAKLFTFNLFSHISLVFMCCKLVCISTIDHVNTAAMQTCPNRSCKVIGRLLDDESFVFEARNFSIGETQNFNHDTNFGHSKPVCDLNRRPRSGQQDSGDLLLIGIPTIERKDQQGYTVEYLTGVLDALVAQICNPDQCFNYPRIRVVVMNNGMDGHEAFKVNRDRIHKSHCSQYFEFVENLSRQVSTPFTAYRAVRDFELSKDDEISNLARALARPKKKTKQQTRDVVSLIQYIAKRYPECDFLFMEDDFEVCPNGVYILLEILSRLKSVDAEWFSARVSFGLNGVIVQGQDLGRLGEYLWRHQARKPPDHLVSEWTTGETKEASLYKRGRQHYAYKYNIFEHRGVFSSLRKAKSQSFPKCWETLRSPTVYSAEAFDLEQCAFDDIWPCAKFTRSTFTKVSE